MLELIESRGNPKIRHVSRLFKEKKYRRINAEVVLEGEKLLLEQLQAGADIRLVLISAAKIAALWEITALLEEKNIVFAPVLPRLFDHISDVDNPQGVTFTMTAKHYEFESIAGCEQFLILDGVSDPGNLGTIIRTAQAFGIKGLIFSPDTVDYTAPKVIRATMGTVLSARPVIMDVSLAMEKIKALGLPVYGAALGGESQPLNTGELARVAVVIGNEAQGIRPDVLAALDGTRRLPMTGEVESLNAAVAASIILWEMQKARTTL